MRCGTDKVSAKGEAMEGPHELREKARNYRRLALTIIDRQTVDALHDLAEKYETLSANLEQAAVPSSAIKD